MERNLKRVFYRSLILIYAVGILCELVAVLITGYVLAHPELGLREQNLFVSDLVSDYGIVGGLLLSFTFNTWLTFLSWTLFVVYLKVIGRGWRSLPTDCFAYSWMIAYGLAFSVFYAINAINDVSVLFSHTSPNLILQMMQNSGQIFLVVLVVSLALSLLGLLVYHILKRKELLKPQ